MTTKWNRPAAAAAVLLGAGALLAVAPGAGAGGPAANPGLAGPSSLGSLVTYGYGNGRTGLDTVDPPIAGLSAAPAWDDNLDGAVFGEPLVYDGEVFVGTEGDSVYALYARTGKVAWKVRTGTPVRLAVADAAPTLSDGCGDINPLGITGTPVIDPASSTMYVAEETMIPGKHDWRHIRHWLVAISLTTHRELWHRDIDPPGANRASTYYVAAEQERPALTLANGRVYVSFGGLNGDCGQYHGFVVSMAQSGAGSLASYEVPSSREGAIWATDGAAVSASGDLYVTTGNGASSSGAHFDEGNSVIELSPQLRRIGLWAPSNWLQLNDDDGDLGSGGAIELPGTSLLFVAGKPSGASYGYLMREGRLGGVGRRAFRGAACSGGGVFGADASDVVHVGSSTRLVVYLACGGGTTALLADASTATFHRLWTPSSGAPNGSPIVAGGWVFALDWNSSQLYAMNPLTGHVAFVRRTDRLNHFAAPGFGDSVLAVPTAAGVEGFAARR